MNNNTNYCYILSFTDFSLTTNKPEIDKNHLLYKLVLKYNTKEPDRIFFYNGIDNKNRIEIAIKIGLFEVLKQDDVFITYCEQHLRRIRNVPIKSNFIDTVLNTNLNFDNDLDR
jgi:hypothetical protein